MKEILGRNHCWSLLRVFWMQWEIILASEVKNKRVFAQSNASQSLSFSCLLKGCFESSYMSRIIIFRLTILRSTTVGGSPLCLAPTSKRQLKKYRMMNASPKLHKSELSPNIIHQYVVFKAWNGLIQVFMPSLSSMSSISSMIDSLAKEVTSLTVTYISPCFFSCPFLSFLPRSTSFYWFKFDI